VTVAYPDALPPVPGAPAPAGPLNGPLNGAVYPRSDPTEYLEGGPAILAALAAVTAAERTGTAWLMGGSAGALHFRNGRVVGAELDGSPVVRTLLVASGRLTPQDWDDFARSWSGAGPQPPPVTPAARGTSILEWAALAVEATVEAAAELLPTNRDGELTDMVFQPDAVPGWTGSARPVELSWLRREIDRRQSVLDRLRPVLTPDTPLARASPEWAGPVQVSAQQWRVLTALPDGATARSVARGIGAGTFATTLVVRSLVRLGMVTAVDVGYDADRFGAAFSHTLFMDALRGRG
jgi:hypothetical protein